MKVLIVTSEVTFMPENYRPLLYDLLEDCEDIFGLVILKNFELSLMGKALGLIAAGAPRIGRNLLKNTLTCHLRRREEHFKNHGKVVRSFKTINQPEVIQWIKDQGVDLILNIRTRCIYKKEALEAAKLGCINLHHGRLPKDRGTLCDLWALSEGREAGFTLHEMTEKVDDGKILKVVTVDPGKEKNFLNYLKKTPKKEKEAIIELIEKIKTELKIPEGIENKHKEQVYYKTPDLKNIKKLKAKGMLL